MFVSSANPVSVRWTAELLFPDSAACPVTRKRWPAELRRGCIARSSQQLRGRWPHSGSSTRWPCPGAAGLVSFWKRPWFMRFSSNRLRIEDLCLLVGVAFSPSEISQCQRNVLRSINKCLCSSPSGPGWGQGQREHQGTLGDGAAGQDPGRCPTDPGPSEELGRDGCPPTLARQGLHPVGLLVAGLWAHSSVFSPNAGSVPRLGGRGVESGPRWA